MKLNPYKGYYITHIQLYFKLFKLHNNYNQLQEYIALLIIIRYNFNPLENAPPQ